MTTRDPLWISFPRWLEESDIPAFLHRTVGEAGWPVFRKLIEIDCDQNLTPDWFAFHTDDLSRWTGLPVERILPVLDRLEDDGWLERMQADRDVQKARIIAPLATETDEATLRARIAGGPALGGNYILRYAQDILALNRVEKVIYLYQMLFGARFTPTIAQDLEEIANTYDMGLIYDIFSEAYSQKVKSLSWVKSRLNKRGREAVEAGGEDEEMTETGRGRL